MYMRASCWLYWLAGLALLCIAGGHRIYLMPFCIAGEHRKIYHRLPTYHNHSVSVCCLPREYNPPLLKLLPAWSHSQPRFFFLFSSYCPLIFLLPFILFWLVGWSWAYSGGGIATDLYLLNPLKVNIYALVFHNGHNHKLFCSGQLVFSSSATVYGWPKEVPCTEESPLCAMNPYGRTKVLQFFLFCYTIFSSIIMPRINQSTNPN